MKHNHARHIIPTILDQQGFDERAQALIHGAILASDDSFDYSVAERVLKAATSLPEDHARVDHAPALTSPLPDDIPDLCQQLAPLVVDYPQNTPIQLASLQHLTALWPHASRQERTRMRLNWLASLSTRTAPEESYLTRSTLRSWQRDLPTVNDDSAACASVLCEMLDAPDAKNAYNHLSLYLGMQADLPTLSWTLGVLSERILLHHFDPRGRSINALLGTIACEQLVEHCKAETLVTLLSQLAHHIWWCAQRNKKRELRPSSFQQHISLVEAVEHADIYAAQKAARLALADRERYWQEVCTALNLVLDCNHHSWTSAVSAIVCVRFRGGERAVLSPDDAATIGAALASAKYRADNRSSRLTTV
ncbi:MAG: hypothetical protein EA401_09690 [Planctomycetota bacterium]|nr:MAG: hypothetical protein EA401_09690 [Planctomycetota bacterium]